MEERPPVWRVAANMLNKQSRTADEGLSFSLGFGEVLTISCRKNVSRYEPFTEASQLDIGTFGGDF
jgi:hypothetical protein